MRYSVYALHVTNLRLISTSALCPMLKIPILLIHNLFLVLSYVFPFFYSFFVSSLLVILLSCLLYPSPWPPHPHTHIYYLLIPFFPLQNLHSIFISPQDHPFLLIYRLGFSNFFFEVFVNLPLFDSPFPCLFHRHGVKCNVRTY